MTENRYYPQNGAPTKPDVDKLLERWPTDSLEMDQEIHDHEIAEVLGLRRSGSTKTRWISIELAWRKRVMESTGLLLKRRRKGNCLVILNPMEVCDLADQTMQSVHKATSKRLQEVASTNPRNAEERRQVEHRVTLLAQFKETTARVKQQILSLPRKARQLG